MKKNLLFVFSILMFHIVAKSQDATLTDQINIPPFTVCGSSTNELTVHNSSTTMSSNTNYSISWGDNTFNSYTSFTDITHNYPSQGYYNLIFTVTNSSGVSHSNHYTVFIGSNPAIPFTNPGQYTNQCLPFTITIPLDASVYNTPGTLFIMSSNDGSISDTLTAPLTTNYSHTFNQSSCGVNSPIANNAYNIKIIAKNACDTIGSFTIISPITTVVKPIAKFTISPDSLSFPNTAISFTNTSKKGIIGNCDSITQIKWSITPGVVGVDYTIISGGPVGTWLNSPATTQPLVVSFITPANYSIKLNVRTKNLATGSASFCSTDSITKTIYTLPDRNVGINVLTPQNNLHIKDVMKIEPRSTPPSNPTKGVIYFDGILNKLRVFDGTTWQDCW